MKKLIGLSGLALLAACSMLNPLSEYEGGLKRATAERWSSGAPGGGRGATFRLNFYPNSLGFECDTLWVNDIPLETEKTTVGDTIYISSFFCSENVEAKTLANAAEYSGKLRLITNEKVLYLPIDSFQVIRSEPRP